ncbi:MAG: hypothetical protein ACFKPT_05145 [Gloeotrichia echinulata GP01]
MNLPERFEVKGKLKYNAFQRATCIFMFVISFLGLFGAPLPALGLMAFSLLFIFLPNLLSQIRPVSLVLTHEGIEYIAPFTNQSQYIIPWRDIDDFLVLTHYVNWIPTGRHVGVRLKRYDGYLKSTYKKSSNLISDKQMMALGERILLFTRKKYNCEVILWHSDLDRSVSEFIELLGQYCQAFGRN